MRSREAQEQAIVIQWCKMQEKKYPALENIFAIPNGGYRNKIEAANLKKQGVKAGVLDLFLAYPNGKHAGLFIEMKWGKNKCTPNQLEWIERLTRAGYEVNVCWSSEKAIESIKNYLGIGD